LRLAGNEPFQVSLIFCREVRSLNAKVMGGMVGCRSTARQECKAAQR
jgi:hypothetical protein